MPPLGGASQQSWRRSRPRWFGAGLAPPPIWPRRWSRGNSRLAEVSFGGVRGVGRHDVPSNMATMRPIMAVSGLPKLVLKAGVFTSVDGLELVVDGAEVDLTQAAHQAIVVADQHEAQGGQHADGEDQRPALERRARHGVAGCRGGWWGSGGRGCGRRCRLTRGTRQAWGAQWVDGVVPTVKTRSSRGCGTNCQQPASLLSAALECNPRYSPHGSADVLIQEVNCEFG